MTSFENCEMLYNKLSKKENLQKMGYRILYSTSDKSMRYLQEEYKKLAMNGNRTILIGNISFFTGIDLRPPLHKGTKCDMRFKSSLNSARLNLLNPYK